MVWIAQNFATVLRVVLSHADKSTERQEANEEKAAAAGWSWPEQRIAGTLTCTVTATATATATQGKQRQAIRTPPLVIILPCQVGECVYL